jgi:hypothetical protein
MKPTKEQLEIIALVENLIRVARRHNVYIAGFAFSSEPNMLTNFGNCTDCGDLRLFESLVHLRDKQIARGEKIQTKIVEEVN